MVAPLPLDRPIPAGRFASPQGGLLPLSAPPPVYAAVATLPPGAVLIELPYGIVEWDLRAMYYTLAHRRPIVNGYSGGMPDAYQVNVTALQDPLDPPRPRVATDFNLYRPHTSSSMKARFQAARVHRSQTGSVRRAAVETGRFGHDVLLRLR